MHVKRKDSQINDSSDQSRDIPTNETSNRSTSKRKDSSNFAATTSDNVAFPQRSSSTTNPSAGLSNGVKQIQRQEKIYLKTCRGHPKELNLPTLHHGIKRKLKKAETG